MYLSRISSAFGWPVPEFAHVPLIHGPDGAKLSKRHGALGVDAYRDLGYLPEPLCNYLLRLGWSHGDDEIITREQAIEWFDLGGSLPLSDVSPADDVITQTRAVQGLRELAERTGLARGASAPAVASAIDFVLEGLYAQKKISRSEERGYAAGAEPAPRRPGRREDQQIDEEIRIPGAKKKYYN